ncbi:MAG TPA: GNAT family protein [Kofleriaceae bacterium]|nr:GNAT family protein [Kofleriaceae bacterium]
MSAPPRPVIPKLSELDLVIETARLRLRPYAEHDVDALWPIVSRPEFPRQMSWAAHRDREETREFVRSRIAALAENEGISWVIEHAGKLVGTIGFDEIRWQVRAWRIDRTELGYWLAPDAWNQGFMTEAASAVVRYGFDQIGLHKITVRCFEANVASRRVIEKVGFRFVGRAEDDVWRDGVWSTHLLYELTSPEWPDVHTTMRINRPRPT